MPSEERAEGGEDATEGRVLAGRYRLNKRIDEGGAGEVWQARDERLDRDVAIKILGPTADEAFRERFADEARRAASVLHPNVVTVFDEGRDGVDAFMVMELVRGRTLRDVVADRGPLRPHEAARLVAQIAAALDAARSGRHPLRREARERHRRPAGHREAHRLRHRARGTRTTRAR